MRIFLTLCGSIYLMSLATLFAEQTPQVRPALLGTGRDSLVNLIDTAKLMKKGQGDAVVRFSCFVSPRGSSGRMFTYGLSDHSYSLAEEAIYECGSARFIPAIYDSRPVWAEMHGTIIFGVIKGKPLLRIFLNQEPEHLKKGDDFISPQEIYRWSDNFRGFEQPSDPTLSGGVIVNLQTDATGKLLSSRVVSQTPPNADFGAIVMKRIKRITFTPAYLHGSPIASSTTWEVVFHGNRGGSYWNNG